MLPLFAARDTTRVAVYEYWLGKRKRRGRPVLRRLLAPTPVSDSNPYNVFRWVRVCSIACQGAIWTGIPWLKFCPKYQLALPVSP